MLGKKGCTPLVVDASLLPATHTAHGLTSVEERRRAVVLALVDLHCEAEARPERVELQLPALFAARRGIATEPFERVLAGAGLAERLVAEVENVVLHPPVEMLHLVALPSPRH